MTVLSKWKRPRKKLNISKFEFGIWNFFHFAIRNSNYRNPSGQLYFNLPNIKARLRARHGPPEEGNGLGVSLYNRF